MRPAMWLDTDEYEEIVATLRACRHFLSLATQDVTYWKWVFLALHNIVQGCMVIALTRSDSFGATDAKQEKAWREAYAKGNPLPTDQEKLLSFLDLYDKIKRKGMLQYSSAERFVPRGSQREVDEEPEFHSERVCSFYPQGMVARIERRPSHCDRLLRRCRISRKTQQ